MSTPTELKVKITSEGRPIPAELEVLSFDGPDGPKQHGRFAVKNSGTGLINLGLDLRQHQALVFIHPLVDGAWRSVFWTNGPENHFSCPPCDGHSGLQWWHRLLGLDRDPNAGQGIRIGVVDAGFRPQGAVGHVQCLSLDDSSISTQSDGPMSHGEKVCRILAGRPTHDDEIPGVAPGAEVYCMDVRDEDGRPEDSRVVDAIDRLTIQYKVDILSLSLGVYDAQGFELVEDAIRTATGRGVYCVVAAGNRDGDRIAFPACLDCCAAVGSLGSLREDAPAVTIAANVKSWFSDNEWRDRSTIVQGFGEVFLSRTSSYGEGLTCVAPGSGLIVGPRVAQADVDGTSFAAPIVTGMLARRMAVGSASSTDSASGPADTRRFVRDICRKLSLPKRYQGMGMPTVS